MSDEILYEKRDSIAWVTLNRPEFRNAQNVAMLRALDGAFAQAMADDAIKVIAIMSSAVSRSFKPWFARSSMHAS